MDNVVLVRFEDGREAVMDFEHTDECEQRERPDECVQCYQSQPAGDE